MKIGFCFLVSGTLAILGCATTAAPEPFQSENRGASSRDRGDDDDDNDSTHDRPASTEPTDTSGVTPTVPAAKGITVWRAHLDALPTKDFGGGKWCDYHVALSNIDLTLTLDPEGHITSSDVTSTMTETATACDLEPLGVQQNSYSFRVDADEAVDKLTVLVAPDPTNLPQANVTLTLEPINDQRMAGRLVFQRTGGAEPALDWNVSTNIELTLTTDATSPSLR